MIQLKTNNKNNSNKTGHNSIGRMNLDSHRYVRLRERRSSKKISLFELRLSIE